MRYLPALCAAAAYLSAAGAELETVVVHASRLGGADQNAVVLTEEDLDAQRAGRAEDALRGLPGLALARSGNVGGLTQARVRGAEANHLLVMLDGIELNNPAAGSEVDFAHLSLAGAARVELVNGPQSAVWGSDALAGLLYIDTTPTSDVTRLDVGGGSHATNAATVHVARVGPQGHVAALASHFGTGGANIARRGDEEDGYRNATLHLNAARQVGPFTLSAVARAVDAESEYDPTPFPNYLPADGDNEGHGRRRYFKLQARRDDTGRWQPTLAVTSARSHDTTLAAGAAAGTVLGERQTLSFANQFALTEAHRFAITVERERQRFRQRAAATPFGDPNQRRRMATDSAALEYQFRAGTAMASLAARFDANSAFGDAHAWRAGVAWQRPSGRLFANVGTGVKNPSFVERFGYFSDAFIGNPRLRPETSREVELGFATQRFSLSLFASELDGEIAGFVFEPALGGFTARNRRDRSRRHGLEASWRGEFRGWALDAHYTFLKATEAGAAEVRRPRHQGRLDATAQLTAALRFGASVAIIGEREDDDFSSFPAARRELGRYTLARMHLSMALSPRASAWLGLENAFDVAYEDVFGYRSPGLQALAGASFEL